MLASPAKFIAQAIGSFTKETLKVNRPVAIVAWDCSYCRSVYSSLPDDLRSKTKLLKILDNTEDLSLVIKTVLSEKADLVIIPNFGVFTGNIISSLVKAGYDGKFIGGDSWGETNSRSLSTLTSGLEFEGFAIRQYSQYFQNTKIDRMKKRLGQQYGIKKFSMLVPNIYDSFAYLIKVIGSMKPPYSRKRLMAMIQKKPDFEGISGKICLFRDWCGDKRFFVVRLNGEGFSGVKTLTLKRSRDVQK